MSTHDDLCKKLGLSTSSDSSEGRTKLKTGGRVNRSGGGSMEEKEPRKGYVRQIDDMSKAKPMKERTGYVRAMKKDGGRTSESSERTWKTSAKQEAAEKREMDSGSKPMGKGAFYKPGIRENAYTIGSNPVRKKLGENGAGQLKPRVEASFGGEIENIGRKIKSGSEDFNNRIRNAFHFQEGGKAEMRKVSCNPIVKTMRNPAKLEKAMIAPKAFARIEASTGGDMENVARKIKSGAKEGLNRAKGGAEDFGRKAKAGLEDFGNKFRNAFHFQEGGEVGFRGIKKALDAQKADKIQRTKDFSDEGPLCGGQGRGTLPKEYVEYHKNRKHYDHDMRPLDAKGGRIKRALGGAGKTRKDQYK
jgi:hypothetical protein